MENLKYLNIENLKITVFQAYLFWENADKNLQNISLKLSSGVREKTDLIVLPEMFNTGFTMRADEMAEQMDGKTMQWLSKTAASYECVITGSLIIKENGNFYNRMIWMKPNGEYQYYDKHHLFSMADENKHFEAGNEQLIVELKGWKIRLAICYDLRFPVWLRNKNAEYDILLLVASWPDKRSSHWRTLIHARAVENQTYVVAVNRVGHDGNQIYHSGHSMCIDPYGNTVYYKPEDEDLYTFSINYPELEKIRRQFPFLDDADNFNLN
ncbi:nitrilase family protein [Pedobacter cryotolerans]|uniref:nitrilase family protein n=1 Tax=Pedobacter cryotolerans TaxID=2571270 RepID=UPI001CEDB1B7|nr:nitrilase family protein [Pedobacter cryotolerans]